jgi:hypothetical protein
MLFAAKTSRLSIYIIYAKRIQESLNPWDQMLQYLAVWNQFLFHVQYKREHENL